MKECFIEGSVAVELPGIFDLQEGHKLSCTHFLPH